MLEGWFDMPKTPKIAPRLNGTPEIRYVRAQIFPAWHDTHRHALSRRSRASLRPLKTTSRTPPCTARRVGVHKAMDHSLAQMQSRMRSCDRRTPSTVKTCTHTAHGPAMAAHLTSRPTPTTAGPSCKTINERGPLKIDELGHGGAGDIGPDTPA